MWWMMFSNVGLLALKMLSLSISGWAACFVMLGWICPQRLYPPRDSALGSKFSWWKAELSEEKILQFTTWTTKFIHRALLTDSCGKSLQNQCIWAIIQPVREAQPEQWDHSKVSLAFPSRAAAAGWFEASLFWSPGAPCAWPLPTTRWSGCAAPPDKRLRKTSSLHQMKFNEEWKELSTGLKDACLIYFFFPSSKRPCIFNGCRLTPVMNPKCPMHIKAGFREH